MAPLAALDRDHALRTLRTQHVGDIHTFAINDRQITAETRESTYVLASPTNILTVAQGSLFEMPGYVVLIGDIRTTDGSWRTAQRSADARNLDDALTVALNTLLS